MTLDGQLVDDKVKTQMVMILKYRKATTLFSVHPCVLEDDVCMLENYDCYKTWLDTTCNDPHFFVLIIIQGLVPYLI